MIHNVLFSSGHFKKRTLQKADFNRRNERYVQTVMMFLWPLNVWIHDKSEVFQIFMSMSCPALAWNVIEKQNIEMLAVEHKGEIYWKYMIRAKIL